MKFPKRFTLSTLLLAMLLASLVFGYATWRKSKLVRMHAELQIPEVYLHLTDNWFWPKVKKPVGLYVRKLGYDEYAYGDKRLNSAEAYQAYTRAIETMREMGVERIDLRLETEIMGFQTNRIIENLDELKAPFYGW